jgi:hypothetical protein
MPRSLTLLSAARSNVSAKFNCRRQREIPHHRKISKSAARSTAALAAFADEERCTEL